MRVREWGCSTGCGKVIRSLKFALILWLCCLNDETISCTFYLSLNVCQFKAGKSCIVSAGAWRPRGEYKKNQSRLVIT